MFFFSNQCSLINNNSKLPTNLNHFTVRCLSSISAGDIGKIIQNLNSKKAHGHDNIRYQKFVVTSLINL